MITINLVLMKKIIKIGHEMTVEFLKFYMKYIEKKTFDKSLSDIYIIRMHALNHADAILKFQWCGTNLASVFGYRSRLNP